MAWFAENNRRNKLIWNYGFEDGNKVGTSTAISWLSTIGLGCVLVMLLCSMSPTFWLEGLSITDFVWALLLKEHFWKITLQDSLIYRLFYHLFTVGLVWILDMLFIQMLFKLWMVKIENEHSSEWSRHQQYGTLIWVIICSLLASMLQSLTLHYLSCLMMLISFTF